MPTVWIALGLSRGLLSEIFWPMDFNHQLFRRPGRGLSSRFLCPPGLRSVPVLCLKLEKKERPGGISYFLKQQNSGQELTLSSPLAGNERRSDRASKYARKTNKKKSETLGQENFPFFHQSRDDSNHNTYGTQ